MTARNGPQDRRGAPMNFDPHADEELEALYRTYRQTCADIDTVLAEVRERRKVASREWSAYVRLRDTRRRDHEKHHPWINA